MKIFSRTEKRAVFIILFFIFIISFFNFKTALRRGRDNERQNDLGDIKKILDTYKDKYKIYPETLAALPNYPKDPGTPQGHSYLYLTNGKHFQLYASLEGFDEDGFNPQIAALNLKCGNFICNIGRASGNIPLDKSLEEYENEINAKK